MATLTLSFNNKVLQRFSIKSGGKLSIGRREDNRIVIDNMSVSGYHAEFVSEGGSFHIRDLKSKNGTFVNQQLVSSSCSIQPGDVITIGKHELTLILSDQGADAASGPRASADPSHEQTRILETHNHRELLKKFASTSHKAPLLTLAFKGKTLKKYVLKASTVLSIGRLDKNDVVIDNTAVSGKHASISYEGNAFVLKDLDSTNGTLINDKAVKQAVLNDGDVIRIGKHDLVFNIMGDFEPHEIANDPNAGPAYFQSDKTTFIEQKDDPKGGKKKGK